MMRRAWHVTHSGSRQPSFIQLTVPSPCHLLHRHGDALVQPKPTMPVKARGALCLSGHRSLGRPTCSLPADSYGPQLDRA